MTECESSTKGNGKKVLYLNARSLINKLDMFRATVDATNPDVIGVTERWANEEVLDSELGIDGYVMFRRDRNIKKQGRPVKGGGVLLYVREELDPTEFSPTTKFPEHVWCKVMDRDRKELFMGVCYRSANTELFEDGSHELLRQLLAEVGDKNVLIMGDLNYRGIEWDRLQLLPQANKECQQFLEAVEDNFYTQHVLTATRGDAILDVVLTSEAEMVSDVRVVDCLDSSDHSMLVFKLHIHLDRVRVNRQRYDYNRANYAKIREELDGVDWLELMSRGRDTEGCWNEFKELLLSLESKYVPKRKTAAQRNRKAIWMTYRAMNLVSRKRAVFAKYKDKDHPAVKNMNKKVSKEVKKQRKGLKRNWHRT